MLDYPSRVSFPIQPLLRTPSITNESAKRRVWYTEDKVELRHALAFLNVNPWVSKKLSKPGFFFSSRKRFRHVLQQNIAPRSTLAWNCLERSSIASKHRCTCIPMKVVMPPTRSVFVMIFPIPISGAVGKKKSNRVRAFLERSWKILECKIRWGLDVIWNKGIRSSYTQGFDPTWAYSTGWMIISTKTGLHWQHLQYQSGRFAIFFFGSFWIHLVQQYNKPCCIFLGIDFSSKDFEGFGPNFSRLPSTELPIVALPLSVWFEGFLHHRTTATCQDLGSDEKSILPPDDLW